MPWNIIFGFGQQPCRPLSSRHKTASSLDKWSEWARNFQVQSQYLSSSLLQHCEWYDHLQVCQLLPRNSSNCYERKFYSQNLYCSLPNARQAFGYQCEALIIRNVIFRLDGTIPTQRNIRTRFLQYDGTSVPLNLSKMLDARLGDVCGHLKISLTQQLINRGFKQFRYSEPSVGWSCWIIHLY